MARDETIQWNVKQYLGDSKVLAMDWDSTGMHVQLLMISTQEKPPGSLPNDMVLIRRWLRSPSDDVWRRVQPQIFSAWMLRGDRWFNKGVVETFERKERYATRYDQVPKEYENRAKQAREPQTQTNISDFDVGSKKVNGESNCERCGGTGMRGSYSIPGRFVRCECQDRAKAVAAN